MALTNCGECEGTVSESAAFCPHCGAVFKPERSGPEVAVTEIDLGVTELIRLLFKFYLASVVAALPFVVVAMLFAN